MSDRKLPPASPADAFQTSVLDSIQQQQHQQQQQCPPSPSLASGQRPSKRKQTDMTSVSRDDDGSVSAAAENQASLPPPPPVRRSSSSTPMLRMGSTSTKTDQQSQASSRHTKPLIRRRSSLFDSLPGRSRTASLLQHQMAVPETRPSPPSFLSRLSQSATLIADDLSTRNVRSLAVDDNDDDATTVSSSSPCKKRRRTTPRGTLFGAVMEKLGGGSSNSNSKEPSPGTPQREQSASASPSKAAGFMSPSGKSIMNIVNKFVMHSPFRFSSPAKKRRSSSPPTSARNNEDASNQSSGSVTPRRRKDRQHSTPSPKNKNVNEDSMSSLHDDDNWREAVLQKGQAEILDWTLRQRWQIECHPPEQCMALLHNREWRQALQYWNYTPTVPLGRSCNDETTVKAKGQLFKEDSYSEKATPAASIGKSKIGKDKGSNLEPSISKDKPLKDPQVELASRLVRKVKAATGNAAANDKIASSTTRPVMTATATGQNGSTETMEVSPQQQEQIREWQQAFRSLYMQWRQSIETAHPNNGSSASSTTAQLDHSFYTIAKDHVALFRLDTDDDNVQQGYIPRVFISYCDDSMVQALRELGVDAITVLKDPIQERMIQQLREEEEQRKKASLPMSPTVKADLEALRKAQTYGEVAGADVSIKIKSKAKNGNGSNAWDTMQPLAITVSGHDHVAAFFEVYLNRLGNVSSSDDHSSHSLPRLVCPRELGPFWHASLESLQVRPVPYLSKNKNTSTATATGILELDAPVILPNIVRRLVALSSKTLTALHHSTKENTKNTNSDNTTAPIEIHSPTRKGDAVEEPGSHYVVFHAMDGDKNEAVRIPQQILSSKRSLEQASLLFNGIRDALPNRPQPAESLMEDDARLPECQSGKALQLIVWDVSRSNVAACKFGGIA